MKLLLVTMLVLAAFTLVPTPVADAGCTPTPEACVIWCPPPPSAMACRIFPYGSPIGPL